MSEREPISEAFDAVVDFYPPETMPELVYGLVKLSYSIVDNRLLPSKAAPLNHDIRQSETPYPLAPGSDFWPMRMATDVIVSGAAFAPGGRPVRSQMIRVTVGDDQKLIAVYGDRTVEWPARGQLRFGQPEPFTEIPVVWSNAYGGCDPRVPIGVDPMTVETHAKLELDHPGAYPRNPFGRGYVVVDDPVDGLRLPNLEDPQQLLRPETLITGDPRRWYLQPLPVCYEPTNFVMFSRYSWLGIEAWYPPPADAPLREIGLNLLPSNWKDLAQLGPGDPLQPLTMQEGPMGMVYPDLQTGTPIIVEGMHPELPHIGFPVPPPPKLDFYLDGKVYNAPAQATRIVVKPDQAEVSITWAARHYDLPRPFVPGIHANIPLALVIDDAHTIRYDSPIPLREQVQQGDQGRPGEPRE